jgi:hypothetical protein
MTKILDQVPYSDTLGSVVVCGEQVHVLAHQIIVWVSVTLRTALQLDVSTPRVPAILDTGNTFGFSIAEEHLVRWCGLSPQLLRVLGPIFINRQHVNRHAANVWLHRNRPKKRDALRDQPFCLELKDGIALCPADARVPVARLPLLGLRALDENRLRCTVNGKNRTVTLSTTGTA